jgi:putative transposase
LLAFLIREEAGMAAVAITRMEDTAQGLRAAAKRSEDVAAARRMLALALVLEGKSRSEAATSCGMDRQSLRDWVHRYNAEGLAGLHNRTAPGAKPKLSPEQERAVAELVRNGPDLAEHGVVRWRRIDLAHVIEQRYGVTLAERSVGDLLRRLGFRRISVRPRCPEQDAEAQETHKKTFPIWSLPASRRMRRASRSSFGGRTKLALASRAR